MAMNKRTIRLIASKLFDYEQLTRIYPEEITSSQEFKAANYPRKVIYEAFRDLCQLCSRDDYFKILEYKNIGPPSRDLMDQFRSKYDLRDSLQKEDR